MLVLLRVELRNELISRRGELIFARKREILVGGVLRVFGVRFCVFWGSFRVLGGVFALCAYSFYAYNCSAKKYLFFCDFFLTELSKTGDCRPARFGSWCRTHATTRGGHFAKRSFPSYEQGVSTPSGFGHVLRNGIVLNRKSDYTHHRNQREAPVKDDVKDGALWARNLAG